MKTKKELIGLEFDIKEGSYSLVENFDAIRETINERLNTDKKLSRKELNTLVDMNREAWGMWRLFWEINRAVYPEIEEGEDQLLSVGLNRKKKKIFIEERK